MMRGCLQSSSFLLTCHASQLWKCHQESRERKRRYLLTESLKREAVSLLKPSFYVIGTGTSTKLEQDVSWPKTPPVQEDIAEDNDHVNVSDGKKVRFDVEFSPLTSNVANEEHPRENRHEEYYEKYYAEFEDSWKDLCDRYEKLKCNRKGVIAAEGGNYQHAMSHFATAGEAGCAKAYFNLGLMYETGVGSAKDTEQAMHLYKQATLHGNAHAAHNLALIYLNRALAGDLDVAVDLLKKASSQGLSESKTELGVLYTEQGNIEEACKLFAEAAQQEDADAVYFLGVCYENGLGVEKNECKAAELYRKASKAGNNQAQYSLAFLFEHGLGGLPIDKSSAAELYKQSADSGNNQAKEKVRGLCEDYESSDETGEICDSEQPIRISSSSPAIFSYLQNNLLQLNHSDWELNTPSLQKSSTHTGTLKQDAPKQSNSSGDFFEVEKAVINNKASVLFTLGDELENDEDSITSWKSSDTQSSLVSDGGFGDFPNLSLINTEQYRSEKRTVTSDRFVLDGGFGNLQNLSKNSARTGFDRTTSGSSLASFGSDSNFSIAFDEHCTSVGLICVAEN